MALKRKIFRLLRKSCQILTLFSPALNSMVRYAAYYKQLPDLKNPGTFSEKLVYLKLNRYSKDPQVIRCADKVAVREFVKERGYEDLLNPVIGIYDSVDQIPWEQLPEKFALKWNFGATYNIICDDKNRLDVDGAIKQLKRWRRTKCWLQDGEMQYKYCPKKLLCEEYLDAEQGVLPSDYKLYCFHGEVKAILLISDRNKDKKGGFFTADWRYIGPAGENYLEFEQLPPRPSGLRKMVECAQTLSNEFPFVRVDFYQCGDKTVFGEMTFTPAAGIFMAQTDVDGVSMGDMLHLENEMRG